MTKPFLQGKFVPKNPNKYIGDVSKIVYRSSWELKAFKICDLLPSILQWSSEEIAIKYYNPVSQKYCRYYPDLILKVVDNKKRHMYHIIEIKPKKQTTKPIKTKRKHEKTFLQESMVYSVNLAKWNACMDYCNSNGYQFHIWTEKELGIKH